MHDGLNVTPHRAARPALLSTAEGTRAEAFGLGEWGLLVSAAGIWGSSFLFIELGLDSFRPGVVTLARVALGALTLALFRRARRPVGREHLPQIALLGLTWVGIPLILFPVAQQWIDSSLAGMLNSAVPLASALFATLLLRRLPGRRQLWGLILGFSGVVMIAWPTVRHADATALGVVLVLIAVMLYGLSASLTVPLQQRYGALPVLLRAQLAALVVVLPFGLIQLPGTVWSATSALAMLPLGILGTGLAYVAMATLIGRVGATRGSITIYFVPAVAILLGIVFLDERIAALALAGVVLTVTGAWLTSRAERPNG